MLRRYLLALMFMVPCALKLTAAPGHSETDSILASVNGEAISLMDVLPLTVQKEFQLGAVYSGKLLEQEIHELRRKAVDRIIDHKLVQAEYAKQSFKISNRDIERELDTVAENMGCRSREEWLRRLRKEGLTLEQMRQDVEKGMMVQLMVLRQVKIDGSPTPREMYEYFKANEKKYSEAEKIGLSMLKLSASRPELERDAGEISAALAAADADFAALVAKYTPEAGDGYLGEIERKLLRPEFAAALPTVTPGKVVGPLKVDGGMVWLKVVSHKQPLGADFAAVESRIRQDMENSRRERVLNDYFRKLRSRAVVEYYF